MKTTKEDLVLMPGIDPVREDYATSLAYYRNLKHFSQGRLAKLSGVNVRMIQYYEQGVNDINKAQVGTIRKLAQALDCSIEDLID